MSGAQGAREAALEALERCRRDGAWSAMALDAAIERHGLDRRDAAFASRLMLGVLQNDRYLDHYIDLYRGPKAGKLQPKLRDILRLGAYQLLFMDKVPRSAAVNESVKLCKTAGLDRASGLANAVLRHIAEARESLPPIPGEGSAAYLSLRYSHPLWLAERLITERGYAFTEAFFAANNDAAPLTLQVNSLKISLEDYRRALQRMSFEVEEQPGLPGSFSLRGGQVSALPGFDEGLFYVQDRAARLAVEAAGAKKGMKVLDACAAPGGKSFACAIRMENEGRILSCDIHEKKLRLLKEGAQRLGISCIETRAMDARAFDPALDSVFDLALADVPCSGLGVIRKRPEIRQKREEEIAALPAIQADILDSVCRCVKPGGVLLYSTCTVLRTENQDQVRAFLDRHQDYEAEDFCLGEIRSRDGMCDLWPHREGTDGFFIAKLRRKQP